MCAAVPLNAMGQCAAFFDLDKTLIPGSSLFLLARGMYARDYYRRLSGEHPDWDDYRAAMERDRRLIVRVTVDRAGPDRSG